MVCIIEFLAGKTGRHGNQDRKEKHGTLCFFDCRHLYTSSEYVVKGTMKGENSHLLGRILSQEGFHWPSKKFKPLYQPGFIDVNRNKDYLGEHSSLLQAFGPEKNRSADTVKRFFSLE